MVKKENKDNQLNLFKRIKHFGVIDTLDKIKTI